MSTFAKDFNFYATARSKQLLDLNIARSSDFIKFGVLSIFDGKNSMNYMDGAIDANELSKISEKEYNQRIKELKICYKQMMGKELNAHVPTYYELKMMQKSNVEDFIGGNLILCNVMDRGKITASEIDEVTTPNGKITFSEQEGSGNCYIDAALMSLSQTVTGRNYIKNAIKSTENGYLVYFRGANKQYFITKEELRKAQDEKLPRGVKKYSSGDADAVLFAIAIEKHRKATGYKLPWKNTKAVKGYDDYLSTGDTAEVMQLITGKKECYRTFVFETSKSSSESSKFANHIKTKGAKKTYYTIPNKVQEVNVRLKKLNQGAPMACTFSCVDNNWGVFKKYNLHENHAYTIKTVDYKNKYAIISNPHWGNFKEIKIPLSEFYKYIASVDYVNIA